MFLGHAYIFLLGVKLWNLVLHCYLYSRSSLVAMFKITVLQAPLRIHILLSLLYFLHSPQSSSNKLCSTHLFCLLSIVFSWNISSIRTDICFYFVNDCFLEVFSNFYWANYFILLRVRLKILSYVITHLYFLSSCCL